MIPLLFTYLPVYLICSIQYKIIWDAYVVRKMLSWAVFIILIPKTRAAK